ncbi:cytochrome c oxidase accessory protein CcoG [Chelatococcus sp. SYSU_G07232]|uniref:Cytochrome c oxidase accessory protein CcoG n=1 Tax=Chelatococcus albus TaxID=3047466 RepID=A0ABT7AF73_9HYPH|nr:cytochrome c oxidase accessory protein CcoG [Chelatococcus sp. SYSU_G07232]MDJ1158028.1 cytochrome c oxidase accessory protein CcoG [Chelatococcus sp. SYSU_G07232]
MQTRTASSDEAPAAVDGPLYEARRKIYPQRVTGAFRRIKWIVLFITLGIYYFLPFVRWDRGPNAPAQAVLVDFPNRRFYFFFIEIWPQEVYYLTGLLIIAALVLFLMNAVAGRVWCGYLCPQTVWTDLFLTVERWIEGDRRERMRKDARVLTLQTVTEKAAKHAIWLLIAWWTGGAWVLYFADAPTLVKELATFEAPVVAYVWIGILTFTTYALAGHMREQVCLYMCPWPRIQAALTDEEALNVTYRYDRGEPRGSAKKNALLREQGQPAGDCIDCLQCVNVCPTGVDIREGANLGCIQCGLCIDACDGVMEKIGRPPRLIAYDTDLNIRRRIEGKPTRVRILRLRTILYLALIVLVGGVMLYALATREASGVSVIHDRNPIFVRLSDGAIRNAYTMRVLNKTREPRRYVVTIDGLPDATLEVVGESPSADGRALVEVGPDQTQEFRVLVTARGTLPPAAALPVTFRIDETTGGGRATATDHFKGP